MTGARCGVALLAVVLACVAAGDEAWDAREARVLRERFLPSITKRPDYAHVKSVFEKAIANDPTAKPGLIALLSDANEDVAATAARALGRFPGGEASAALKGSYAGDARSAVRMGALEGLTRMRDASAGSLAKAALAEGDPLLQGAGLGALEEMDDPADAPAVIAYIDRHPEDVDPGLFEMLGKLGDLPGATRVRDRLAAEAANKGNAFDRRVASARGLDAMGLGSVARRVLDAARAEQTYSSLQVVREKIRMLAAQRVVSISGQSQLDVLLRDISVQPRTRVDEWMRPLRTKFVSAGIFNVVSDGPDEVSGTADDLSTAEGFDTYVARVFGDVFGE